MWTISLKISAGTIHLLSEDHIDPEDLSLSSRVPVKNWQPEVGFSLGYLFLWETHYNQMVSKWLLQAENTDKEFLDKSFREMPVPDTAVTLSPSVVPFCSVFPFSCWDGPSEMARSLKFLNLQTWYNVAMFPWPQLIGPKGAHLSIDQWDSQA